MTEVLSQEEIDRLLAAINADDKKAEKDSGAYPDTRKIKIYDYKRPERFSREKIRTISIMHEAFARHCAAYLSTFLDLEVRIHVASVDQVTYEEFIRSIPNPTTLAVVGMEPLRGSVLLEMDPAVTMAILDKLLGGPGEGTRFHRELTDIETAILREKIIPAMLAGLRDAWQDVADFGMSLAKIETNPQFAMIAPPDDITALVTLETMIGDTEGMINVCVPYITIEPVLDKLSPRFWYNDKDSQGREGKNGKSIDIMDIPAVLVAELFSRACTVGEIGGWEKNKTVIYPGAKKSFEKCVVKMDEYSVFIADIEKTGDVYRRRIRISEILEPRKERSMTETASAEVPVKTGGVAGILRDVKMDLSVELGRTRQPVKNILAIKEGSIIELDTLAGEPVTILANGRVIAKGEVVIIDENFGVRVTELLAPDGDSLSKDEQ